MAGFKSGTDKKISQTQTEYHTKVKEKKIPIINLRI